MEPRNLVPVCLYACITKLTPRRRSDECDRSSTHLNICSPWFRTRIRFSKFQAGPREIVMHWKGLVLVSFTYTNLISFRRLQKVHIDKNLISPRRKKHRSLLTKILIREN